MGAQNETEPTVWVNRQLGSQGGGVTWSSVVIDAGVVAMIWQFNSGFDALQRTPFFKIVRKWDILEKYEK